MTLQFIIMLAGWVCCAGAIGLCAILVLLQRNLLRRIRATRHTLRATLRQQQGMVFKFIKVDGKFIHTLCEGELVHKLGYDSKTFIGRTLGDVIPDALHVADKERHYELAWQGRETSYEGCLNGVWYFASLRPIVEHGRVTEVIASCVDITNLKKAESALRQNEQMYRLIAESSADLIRIVDSTLRIRYASPSHGPLLGYLPEELEGRSALMLVSPEDRQTALQDRERILEHKALFQAHYRLRHRDGTDIPFDTHISPVIDTDGTISNMVVVSRDLTNRIKMEEESRKNEKLALAGQLAAGIAHEIRNPLTAIKGFTKMLREPSEKQSYYAGIVLSELTSIEAIVNEFLLLAKPQHAEFKRHDIFLLLQDVVNLLRAQALMQNVEILLEPVRRRVNVLAVGTQIKQVFINIVKNAIEAMPDGGHVHLLVNVEGEMVSIRIQDEGVGIDEERIKHLGEPFYTTREKGSGLGLMVSYKIVRDHGGDIDITSSTHRGTAVEIRLPVDGADENRTGTYGPREE
ncbi:PAS domain S-box protein [Alicyclobacillus fastidiosus]|uniref:histidine kinase n=1 Tax=Alicyclobacillus fastidiosus TaxID=392011 RepID=A0ABV5AEB0_9BACL|nr:PAS domain S-box protein [Alicyclobacillus fastidiosus]WEH09839.1 PAS domain S-box protein [Alicyclobacillus fastidiosus]